MSAQLKMHIRKGDMVMATTGDDRGKAGKVLQVIPAKRTAIVEGLNYVKKHMRKTQDNPNGGIVQREAPIHISNLRKQEAATEKPARKKSGKTAKE